MYGEQVRLQREGARVRFCRMHMCLYPEKKGTGWGRQQPKQQEHHLRGLLGGSNASFTLIPLNLKRWSLYFHCWTNQWYLIKISIIKSNTIPPLYFWVRSESRGHGLVCGLSIPLNDGWAKTFQNSGQGQHVFCGRWGGWVWSPCLLTYQPCVSVTALGFSSLWYLEGCCEDNIN